MSHFEYQAIPKLCRSEIEDALRRNDLKLLAVASISVALFSNDASWAESVCLRLSSHENGLVRGNAVLGFGHIARVHSLLNEDAIKPIIELALKDKDLFVRGQAEASADDLEHFLFWKINRPRFS